MIRRGYLDLPGGGQVHYRHGGRIGAPSLVLLHQSPSSSAMYEPLMRELAEDFEIWAPDTPGFGGSDPLPGRFSIAAAAQLLAEAMSLRLPGPCYWFGHHTGAALALQLAHARPQQVAALALSGPCLLDEALREKLPQIAAPIPLAQDGAHLAQLWARMQAKDAAAGAAIWQRETLIAAAAGATYPAAYQAVVEVDTATQLRGLDCPTLVFAGTEDPLYPQLDAAYALLRRGRRAEISGARSYVCERQPAQVAALLREFFGGSDGRS